MGDNITSLRLPHKDVFTMPLNKEQLHYTYTVDTRYKDEPLERLFHCTDLSINPNYAAYI